MADYHFPTVVAPEIPAVDLTPLERLVLGAVFDAEPVDGAHVYYYASEGPYESSSFGPAELRAAWDASIGVGGRLHIFVGQLLERHDGLTESEHDDAIDVDLTALESGVAELFQDIVRRSAKIDEIVLTTAYTCTRMRLDGFGGSVTRVTAEAIQFASTTSMLDRMREAKASSVADGRKMLARQDDLAASAGWNPFDLALRIAAWAERQGQAMALTEHLERLAADETD